MEVWQNSSLPGWWALGRQFIDAGRVVIRGGAEDAVDAPRAGMPK
jgi:hypothetical protein